MQYLLAEASDDSLRRFISDDTLRRYALFASEGYLLDYAAFWLLPGYSRNCHNVVQKQHQKCLDVLQVVRKTQPEFDFCVLQMQPEFDRRNMSP
ncbi:hypothetical protein Tco_0666157 [Tanacetum coccineum]